MLSEIKLTYEIRSYERLSTKSWEKTFHLTLYTLLCLNHLRKDNVQYAIR